jgi:hypothetical protein
MSVPTAQEFLIRMYQEIEHPVTTEEAMIEFARLHCTAQREAILEQTEDEFEYTDHPIPDSIENAYPLTNIK